tara:strand:- start:466 stop:714 length:249 start_codon:yes stop_codon:yes gene_type:complete
MSKQKLFPKHKDDIEIKLTQCLERKYNDDQVEAEAANHGWIQALKWVKGYDELYKMGSVPVITGDKDTDALLEDERKNQEEL